MGSDFIIQLYKDQRTVFSLQEIAMLVDESDFSKLKQRINYFVRTRKIKRLRKGIYAKENYRKEELACKIYTPSYISLAYVLRKAGIIFQYDTSITVISYLSRKIEVDNHLLIYRKLKNDILYNSSGIVMGNNGVNTATPERAFLDLLYLNKTYSVNSVSSLNKNSIFELLPLYQSKSLKKRVTNIYHEDRYQ
jgi:hypothetical protein